MTTYSLAPFPKGGGTVVRNLVEGQHLSDLGGSEVHALMRDAGALHFTGFKVDVEIFNAFSRQLCDKLISDPTRQYEFDENGEMLPQKVVAEQGQIEMHMEHGTVPWRPDLLLFYCRKAPPAGEGQTTICDGVLLLESLRPSTRELFATRRIRLFETFSEHAWRGFFAHEHPELAHYDDAAILDWYNAPEGLSCRLLEDGSMRKEYVTSALSRSVYMGELAFVNSIVDSRNRSPESASGIEFEDGSPLPDDVWDEIVARIADCVVDIAWNDGEVCLIDNHRFMHGRRAFSSTDREIYVALGKLGRAGQHHAGQDA
jgi:alpha-ketoglutarate-dependent taurine dioxygenase